MKGKVTACLLAAVAVLASATSFGNIAAHAEAASLDAADQCFLEFMESDANGAQVVYECSPLYNENLEQSGRQYDFTVGEQSGYALVAAVAVGEAVCYEVEELFYNKQSPFENCEGLPVYIAGKTYIEYKEGGFYNLSDGTELSEDELAAAVSAGFFYNGSVTFEDRIQTISYSRKLTDAYNILYDLPSYYGIAGQTGCANTAGTVILGYYDRFYENLIPNFTTYVRIGATIRYRSGSTEIENVMLRLRDLMSTNSQLGTTYSGFQAGMESYVQGQGYTYSSASVFSSGSLNFDLYKTAINDQKPVALFLNGFACLNYIQANDAGTMDTISSGYSASTHVAVGCGYKRETYYNASGSVIDTRTYLKAATGLAPYDIGYFNINGLGAIDRAIAITIS